MIKICFIHERTKKPFLQSLDFKKISRPAYQFSKSAMREFFEQPILCFYFAYFARHSDPDEELQDGDKTAELL